MNSNPIRRRFARTVQCAATAWVFALAAAVPPASAETKSVLTGFTSPEGSQSPISRKESPEATLSSLRTWGPAYCRPTVHWPAAPLESFTDTAFGSPAVAGFNGNLYYAWLGTDGARTLDIAQVQ
jgi:hypothetical protein